MTVTLRPDESPFVDAATEAFATMLDLPLTVVEAERRAPVSSSAAESSTSPDLPYAARVAITGPRQGAVTVRSSSGLLALCLQQLTGDNDPPTPDMLHDMLGELANWIAGGGKSTLPILGHVIGVPERLTDPALQGMPASVLDRVLVTLTAGGHSAELEIAWQQSE